MSIIPLPVRQAPNGLEVAPLVWATTRMTPGLWAPILPGESFDDALVRREAARDILDELLAEYAAAEGASA
ncbi:hypothetical protein [Actinomadura sp. 21ATH]|uniref:hypothetical protein n=1 Tax=Actinomadura sp. 21ATH TaxID=1735444 RepID=UPI0035BF1115